MGALNLEDIEEYIGDKIPVQWAEDDLFVTDFVQPPRPRKTGRTDGRGKPDGRGRSEGRSKSGSSSRPRRRRRTTTA